MSRNSQDSGLIAIHNILSIGERTYVSRMTNRLHDALGERVQILSFGHIHEAAA